MIRTFANGLADLLMGQVPSLEQAEIDFANAYPHGLIFRPDRKYRLPGQNELDDRLILFNFGVGDASIDRFLLDTGQILGVQGTALFQAVDTLPGETYASLNQVRPLIEEWISLGDDIEIGGAASFTGSEKRNFELSEERGGMVVQWMVDELGADPDKIRLRWIGAAWPRFDNDATLLFTHRRVEITRFRTEWEMGEFDRVIPELEDTPQDRRIEQLIAHLQHDKDDVCIVDDPLNSLRWMWMAARYNSRYSWIHEIGEWESFGLASRIGWVTKMRWEVERRLHPGMTVADILTEMRNIDKQIMHVREWTHFQHKRAKAAADLMPDPTGGFLNKPPLYLDNMEKHLHDWFMMKELQTDSIYHSIYKPATE